MYLCHVEVFLRSCTAIRLLMGQTVGTGLMFSCPAKLIGIIKAPSSTSGQ